MIWNETDVYFKALFQHSPEVSDKETHERRVKAAYNPPQIQTIYLRNKCIKKIREN